MSDWINAMPFWMYVLTVFLDGAGLAAVTAMLLWIRYRDKLIDDINEWLREHGIDLQIGGGE